MKKFVFGLLALGVALQSCSSDDDNNTPPVDENEVVAPETFTFLRDGASTVSFSGQTTRILMAEELISALKEPSRSEEELLAMFAHEAGAPNFEDADLNASSKNIRSKTAASEDFFKANTTGGNVVKADFEALIKAQVSEVFQRWGEEASAGVAGQLQEAGGGTIRYVSPKGLEYNQAVNKGLIGGLMVDQALNNYLGRAVLDAGNNRSDNDEGTVAEGKSYTTMEHKWDEAYGYVFGTAPDAANPLANIGTGDSQKGDDSFLSKYLDRVNDDSDFEGIALEIYEAFKLGRAAIVAKNYEIRDQQAAILRTKISEVVGIRAVHYLQQAKMNLTDKAVAFHDLSEGYGFIYSLQFTRKPEGIAPYFTNSEVEVILGKLLEGDGFWDVTAETLDELSQEIASEFSFTVEQAAVSN
jgi:hypothetical protein